jgi:hypothetical protein
VSVLRIHALGAQGQAQSIAAACNRPLGTPSTILLQLQDELCRRYVHGQQPAHPDEWVFEQEVKCLLFTRQMAA